VVLPRVAMAQARRCAQRHPPGALRFEPGGHTDSERRTLLRSTKDLGWVQDRDCPSGLRVA
jgi:hypothetical protein